MPKKKRKIIDLLMYAFFGLGVLISIGFYANLLILGLIPLDWRADKAFNSLDLPSSFSLIYEFEREEKGDWIVVPHNFVRIKSYKVSTNMAEAKEALLPILLKHEDKKADRGDIRLSMHPNHRGLESFAQNCNPGQLPLKSGAYMTIILSDNPIANRITVNADGHVDGLEQNVIFHNPGDEEVVEPKYDRSFCSTEPHETYATFIMWAAR